MRLLSTRAAPFLILAAMALSACGDQLNLTKPAPKDPNHLIICGDECGGGGSPPPPPPPPPPAITGATPPAYLDKDGIHMPWTVSLTSGQGTLSNDVHVSTSVIYGSWEIPTGNQWVQCGTLIAGYLPVTCSMSATATFPLSASLGAGFPVGGSVYFKVYLYKGSTLLDSKTYST